MDAHAFALATQHFAAPHVSVTFARANDTLALKLFNDNASLALCVDQAARNQNLHGIAAPELRRFAFALVSGVIVNH